MPSHVIHVPFPLAFAIVASAGLAPAQLATTPHWSTYFGGSGLEMGQAVCRGPGNLITVVGTTMSSGLATSGAYQTAYGGNGDGFVARFDPSLPPGQQLLWCTYFGGSDLEILFDAEVDAHGNVVFCGLTHSPGLAVNGPGDGFVARLDSTGGNLTHFVCVGGTSYDRITDIARLPNGDFAFVGVTDSSIFTHTPPSAFPTYQGGSSDSIAGAIDLAVTPGVVRWSTFLGGPGTDGYEMVSYLAAGGLTGVWAGNLKRQAITGLPNGRIALVTANRLGATTLAGVHPTVHQPTNQGFADIYYCEFTGSGTLSHATLIGWNSSDFPMDIASHPHGGVVIAGQTYSTNMPTTPNCLQPAMAGGTNDAFVLRFDPSVASNQIRYLSYVGGNGGEDLFTRAEVEPSGLVTLVGAGSGGGTIKFPTTSGALQATAPVGAFAGAIVRLQLANNSRADLAYGTLVADSWTVFHAVALDRHGDAWVAGMTDSPNYPVTNPQSPGGVYDGVVTHLPLLPGGTERQDAHLGTPACNAPVHAGARLHAGSLGDPTANSTSYRLCASNAPPSGLGVLGLALTPITGGVQFENIHILVSPVAFHAVPADAFGFATYPLPIPTNLPPGFQFFTQWAFLTTPTCPGSGLLGATERLQVTL